jgi:pimeloyl-ACP methyl ester carboxylesterase
MAATAKREAPVRRADGFLHRKIDVGAVHLHVAEARPCLPNGGVADGSEEVDADVPLVVLMHGFPEFWWSWRHQLRALADAGIWAVAPDMRGYNESDKPLGVASYELEQLADDIAGLVHALGRKTAIIVGHDWGAMVAWIVAQRHPALVSRLAILNVPHAVQMLRGLRRPKQLRKSWYMFFFQLPAGIPERAVARDDWAYLRKMFASEGFAPDEIEPYVKAMATPGAITAAMSYYRAAIRRTLTGRALRSTRIECPVLVIWGDADRHLGKELAEPPRRFVPNARVEHIPEATHWVQNSAPERVNALLLAFAQHEGPISSRRTP